MKVLKVSPPELDPADLPGSFRRLQEYLAMSREEVDYNLGLLRSAQTEAARRAEDAPAGAQGA